MKFGMEKRRLTDGKELSSQGKIITLGENETC